MSNHTSATREIVQIGLFAALTAALALFPPITFPFLPVPITAQSIGPMLAGAVLGARRGSYAMLLVIAMVAVGLPVLSGGRGGLGVFMSPTGGFLVGWLPAAATVGMLHERFWSRLNYVASLLFCAIGGIGVLYAIGVPWAAFSTGLPVWETLAGSAVFLPGDLAKAALAAAVAMTVKRSYPQIHATAGSRRSGK